MSRASPDDVLGMAFFARVVEARSFSEAARVLGVSKSAVSARIARLEERLGVRLLHRTTRRLALTADGVRVYERCARIVAEADEAAVVGEGASALPRGVLRVHAPSGFAEAHLSQAIGAFIRTHPGLKVELHLSDRLPDMASADEVDVALLIAPRLADSGLTTRKLASIRMVVCAAPEYLRSRGIPFRPQDLVLHDCVSHSIRQAGDELAFKTEEGAISMTSLSTLLVDDARFLREAALRGLGIVMLTEFLVADDLREGRLLRVLDDFPIMELGLHALHAHGKLPPASVRVFLEDLAKHLHGWPKDAKTPPPTIRSTPKGGRGIPMTEQDVRRLNAVADLYDAKNLRVIVASAKVLPAAKIPKDAVTINSRVKLGDREVSVVYPWDSANKKDRVSVLSPLGLELLGASVGAKVDGQKIGALLYQPEAAGDHHL